MVDVKEPVDNQFPKKVEEKGKAEEKETHISQKLRVLLIDDNAVCLSILASQLKHCDFQVTSIKKASEALELLRRNRNGFDIVVTDVFRFDINGFKLSEIIGREFGIPVIMASAMDDKKTMEEGIRCGARDYLVKPVRVGILQNIRQHVIRTPYCCSPLPPVNPPPADTEANNNKITHDGNSANPNKRSHDDDDERKKKMKKVEYEYISSFSEESPLIEKKPRVVWDARLHQKFLDAVLRLDIDRAVPKKILEMMNEPGLTRENIASHLQKFRNIIRKERERNMGMNPRDVTTHVVNPMIQGAVMGNQGLTIKHINFCVGQEMGNFLQRSLHSREQLKNVEANSMHQNVAPSSSSSLAIESGIVSKIMRCPPIDRNKRSIFDLDFVQASPQLVTTSSGLRHPTAGCLVVGNSIDDNLLKLNRMYSSDIVCNQVEHTESSQAGVSINGENKHYPIMSAVADTSFGENSGGHLSSVPNSIVSIQVGHTQTSQVAGSVGEIEHDHFTQPISDGSSFDRGNNAYFSSYNNYDVPCQVRPTQYSQVAGVSVGGIKHNHFTQHVLAGGSSNRGNHDYSLSSGNYVHYKVRPTQSSQAAGVSIGGIKHDHLTQPISEDGNSNRGNNGSLSSSNNYFGSYQAISAPPSQVACSDGGIKHDHFTQPVSAGSSSDRGNNAYLSSCRNNVVIHQPRPPQPSQFASISIGGIKHDHQNSNAQVAEPIHDHSQSVVLTDNTCVGENINGHQTNSVTEICSNIESDIDDPSDEEISLLIKELSNYSTSPSIF